MYLFPMPRMQLCRLRRRRIGLVTSQLDAHLLRFEAPRVKATPPGMPVSLRPDGLAGLLALPLDQKVSSEDYEAKREKWLGRLNRATRAAQTARRSIVFVFEGWDAAGKGGAIRRLTSAIDAQDYRVIPVAKPTDETVMIRADKEVRYEDFMGVVNQLQTDGFFKVGLINEDLS